MKGQCTQLTLGGRDGTSMCSGTVTLTTTAKGQTNVCFRTSNEAVLGFSGLKSSQKNTASTTIDQPVETVRFQFKDGTDRFAATGDCIMDNPAQGSPTITCSARAENGSYQATFVAEGAGGNGEVAAK